jgi:hypothetical protein
VSWWPSDHLQATLVVYVLVPRANISKYVWRECGGSDLRGLRVYKGGVSIA